MFLETGAVDLTEDLSDFGERVAIFGHVFAVIERIFNFKISLAKYRGTFRLGKVRQFGFVLGGGGLV